MILVVFALIIKEVVGNLQEKYVAENSETIEGSPLMMNAFEMITLSQGLNLSALFDRGLVMHFEFIIVSN